jgi:hypothetical protein
MTDAATTLFANQPGDRATAPAAPTTLIEGFTPARVKSFYDGQATAAPTARPPEVDNDLALAGRLNFTESVDAAETRDTLAKGDLFAGPADNADVRRHIGESLAMIHDALPTTELQDVTLAMVHEIGALGLGADEVAAVAHDAKALLKAARAGDLPAGTAAVWATENRKALAQYGGRAGQVFAEAQRMVSSSSEVLDMMQRGLGDHPPTVRAVLAAADRRLRGAR